VLHISLPCLPQADSFCRVLCVCVCVFVVHAFTMCVYCSCIYKVINNITMPDYGPSEHDDNVCRLLGSFSAGFAFPCVCVCACVCVRVCVQAFDLKRATFSNFIVTQ